MRNKYEVGMNYVKRSFTNSLSYTDKVNNS